MLKLVPLQVVPFPVNPDLQVHMKSVLTLRQVAYGLHGFCVHGARKWE